ncbi:MAG: hypothetical protein RLZZ237_3214 [Pseudomonadota bacterium]|jgi:hypothetical protein
MLQYLIQIKCLGGKEHNFTLSKEDFHAIRTAVVGRSFSLENYVCYLTADRKLALSRRPTHVEETVVCHVELCRKLAEAEIEDAEGLSGE